MAVSRWRVGLVAAIGALLIGGYFVWSLTGLGFLVTRSPSMLPVRIERCGRTWIRGGVVTGQDIAKARESPGGILIDPGPLGPCSPGLCTSTEQEAPCATVAYVELVGDRFVAYALSGGP